MIKGHIIGGNQSWWFVLAVGSLIAVNTLMSTRSEFVESAVRGAVVIAFVAHLFAPIISASAAIVSWNSSFAGTVKMTLQNWIQKTKSLHVQNVICCSAPTVMCNALNAEESIVHHAWSSTKVVVALISLLGRRSSCWPIGVKEVSFECINTSTSWRKPMHTHTIE